MKMTIPKPLRCAIYTRKSTEHNLDLAFNSLDAERRLTETRRSLHGLSNAWVGKFSGESGSLESRRA